MLSKKEKLFVDYWRQNRIKKKKVFWQLLIGLPVGALFAIPVMLNFIASWNKRATMWAKGHTDDNTGAVLIIAVLCIIIFVAIFSKQHEWDRCEQQYQQLLKKDNEEQII